ncbi:MAG: VCBS repeat-containing protein [Alphaproteobacteria bacterium]|nr:VCBS repeat-containing protein [Alphaproteobacteria bacterium]
MRALPLLLIAVGCNDYDLVPKDDNSNTDDTAINGTDDTAPPVVDACGELEQPGPDPVALNEECEVSLQTGSFTPVVEWSYGNSSFCGPAAVGQIADTNGSGSIDAQDLPMVLIYQNNSVIAVKGDGSGVLWSSNGNYGQDGGFAIGDVDGDGWPDVVTASSNQVCALNGVGGARLWCTTGLGTHLDTYGYSYPSIADMNGDGNPEVTAGSVILRGSNGAIMARGTRGKGAAPYGGTGSGGTYGALSVPIDLDNDGQMELVTGNTAYDINGNIVWSNGGLDGLVAIADFDGDGQGEIVKTSGIYVTGMETNGTEVWGPLTYTGNLGAPAIDDLDGDGTPEIVFAAQNALIAMEWGGAEMWRATITDNSGAAGPVLFDFELDGYPEVLYADETSIRFFSGLDGSLKFTNGQHASYTILETPIVADVDGDDQVEIVLGHCGNGFSSSFGAVTVYGDADQSWPPGRKIWNQHAYSITNIESLGGVPAGTGGNNFRDFNSFRSGDVGRPPSEYWDLQAQILDVCEDECDSGWLYVAARLQNHGNLDLPAGIPLSLRAGGGGPIVATQAIPSDVPAGMTSEVVIFEVESSLVRGTTPVVTADEDATGTGVVYECEEGNNGEPWIETVCD